MSGIDKIKVFKNLISTEELKIAYDLLSKSDFTSHDDKEPEYWKGRILAEDNVPVFVANILKRVIKDLYPLAKESYGIDIKNVPDEWEGLVHKHFVDDNGDDDSITPHYDSSTDPSYALSVVFYWNDNFEGGDLEFIPQEYTYKPVAGDVVVFLPTKDYLHRVKRIESGIRYASPYWFRFK